jgi:VCBS repeat-containing protein
MAKFSLTSGTDTVVATSGDDTVNGTAATPFTGFEAIEPISCDASHLTPRDRVEDVPNRVRDHAAMISEIVFIDRNVDDLDTLLAGIRPDVEAIVLSNDEPAPRQMVRAMQGREGLEAIHVIAHGRAGEVRFGAGALSLKSLVGHAAELGAIGRALANDGELLLWSCDTAADARGSAFLEALESVTGVKVRAATGVIGSQLRGGKWQLDIGSGKEAVGTPLTADGVAGYAGILAPKKSASLTGITTDSGTAGDFITNDNTLIFGGTESGVSTLGIWISGGSYGAGNGGKGTLVGTVPGQTNWSFNYTGTTLPDGTYTVTLTDGSGGSVLSTQTITIDTSPPTAVATVTGLSADSGSSNSDFYTNVASQTVSGTYTGTLGAGEAIQVSTNGSTWINATASAGTWSASGVTLSAGTGTLQIRTVDLAGNVTSGTGHSYTLDTTAPVISVGPALDIVTADFYSANVSVLLGDGTGSFAAAAQGIAGGALPASVALGDLNGDGRVDIVAADYGNSNVSVLLGDGLGGFTPHLEGIGGGLNPPVVAIGDVNNDGKPDIVTANDTSGNVSVLLGDGTGSFTAHTVASGGSNTVSVALGDLNGDGKLDIVTANLGSSNVGILLGDGAGNFTVSTAGLGGGSNPFSVALGDLNGDGKLDIVTADQSSSNVSVLLGDGSGHFTASTWSTGSFDTYSVAIGDVNGDGKLDIVTANRLGNNVSVLLGDGAGHFTATTSGLAGGLYPWFAALSDVNADGKLDIVTANQGSNNVSVLLGDGAGGFAAQTAGIAGGLNPLSVAIGNVDNARTMGPVSDTGASSTDKITSNASMIGWGDPNAVVTFTEGATVLGTATADTTGVWTFTPTGLADGSHTIVASETDVAGNTGTASLTFTLDTTADSGNDLAVSVSDSSINNAEKTAVAFSVAGLDSDATALVTFTDTASHSVTANVTANGAQTPVDLSSLMDGTISLSIAATDLAGNTASASPSLTFTLDTTAPSLTAVAETPSTGDLSAGNTVTITLTTSEAVTVTGSPTLVLNDGGTATYDAQVTSTLNDPTKLVFDYTVGASDTTVPSLAVTSVNLPSGTTIQDGAGNNTNLSLTGLTQTGPQITTIYNYATPPTLFQSISNLSEPSADGGYAFQFLNTGFYLFEPFTLSHASTLSSVTVDVIGSAPMSIGIWSANNGQPGSELFSLTASPSVDGPGMETFNLPAWTLGSGTYYVSFINNEGFPYFFETPNRVFLETVLGDPTSGPGVSSSSIGFAFNGTPPNDPPTATAIVDSVQEDSAYSINLLTAANATDPDQGDILSVTNPASTVTTSGGRTLVLGTDYTVDLVTGAFALTAAGIIQFNSLKQGASDTLVLSYGVSDGHTDVANTLTLTVVGANDAPAITIGATDAASATVTDIPSALVLTKSGTLSFSDVDVGDTHTVGVAAQTGDLGTLTASVAPNGSGNGSGGSIVWNYQVDESKVSHLTADQTVTDTFTIILQDATGASSQQTVTITLTGTGSIGQVVHLTTSADSPSLGSDATTVVGNASTLNSGDQLIGGGGYDTLALYDAGTYDLRAPLQFSGFQEVDLVDNSAGGQTTTLYVPDAQDLLVATRGNNNIVIYTGTGNDTINAAGNGSAEIHLGSGNDIVNSTKTGGANISLGSGTDTITVTSGGPNQFMLADGVAEITATSSSNVYWQPANQFTLGIGAATITATATGYISNQFTLGSGNANITATAGNQNSFGLGSGDANITATAGNQNYFTLGSGDTAITATGVWGNFFTLGTGTFDIQTSTSNPYPDSWAQNNFSANDPSDFHPGDVINVVAGVGYLTLSGPVGAEYNLSGVSLTNVQNLSLGSGVVFDADASSLAGFTTINGSGDSELRTADLSLDLSGKTVSAGTLIDSTNTTGTTFTVTDAQTALDVRGGPGQDTLITNGFTLTDSQRADIFNQGSVEIIQDATGIYGQPGADLTFNVSGNQTITSGGGQDTFVVNPGFGNDIITDFEPSKDVIQFNPALFANYSAVMGSTGPDGANTVISYDANDSLTLLNVTASSLSPTNFKFA